jgi:hypothetical protein
MSIWPRMDRAVAARLALWTVLAASTAWLAGGWMHDGGPRADTTPAPPRPQLELRDAIARAAEVPLFGDLDARVPATATASAAPSFALKGVITGAVPAAIIGVADRDELVLVGQQIAEGAVLQQVSPTHVVVARDGVPYRIELDQLKSATARGERAPSIHRPPPPATPSAPPVPEAPALPPNDAPAAAPIPPQSLGPSRPGVRRA